MPTNLSSLRLQNLYGKPQPCRPCMNPASVLWPIAPASENLLTVTAQKTRRSRTIEEPITILNRDWKASL